MGGMLMPPYKNFMFIKYKEREKMILESTEQAGGTQK